MLAHIYKGTRAAVKLCMVSVTSLTSWFTRCKKLALPWTCDEPVVG